MAPGIGYYLKPVGSDIGSVRSGWVGLRTYEAKSDINVLDYNSRLRRDSAYPSSYSISTQNVGSIGYLSNLLDFRVSSYGSVSDFRGESPVKPVRICFDLLRFKPKLRNRTVTRHTKDRKVIQIWAQKCIWEIWTQKCRNRELQAKVVNSDLAS